MKKNAKRFLSMLLALSMAFSLLVFPAGATEVHDHEHTEDASAVADKDYEFVVDGNITIVPLKTEGVELDEEDPVIIAVEKELKEMMVLNAEGEPVPLTTEQIQTVLYLFQQYLDQWESNANLLGVQVPFFLQYNDNGEDGLGILGEMLAMAGIDVATVRAGYVTMDDLVGMIYNFYYGDQLGLKYYGNAIASARDEVMDLINNSGAKTEAQKLLVLNDWLAHNITFDMPYIMNSDKEEGEEPMVAADPQEHENYDNVYDVMFEVYKAQIQDTFENNILTGLEAEFKYQYYAGALEKVLPDMYTAGSITEAAKGEEIIAAAKDAYWENAFETEKEELMDSEVYDKAYQEEFDSYLDENCTHNLSAAAFVWTENKDEAGNGTGNWTATADVTCSICDRLYDDVAATTENKKVDATCTEPEATVCVATVTLGEFTATEVKVLSTVGEALGHDWDEGVVTKEPTETAKGEKTFNCDRCEETKVEEIDAIAHEHNYIGVVTTEPTCTEKGVKTYTCTCGEGTYTEEIPAAGHSDSDEDDDELCDVCKKDIPVEGEDEGQEPVNATEEGQAIRDKADAAAKVAAEKSVETAANAAADEALAAATDEDIQKFAEEIVKNNPDAMAAIETQVAELVKADLAAYDAYVKPDGTTIAGDPVAYIDAMEMLQVQVPVTDADGNYVIGEDGNPVMMTIAQQLHLGWDDFWADAEVNGVEVDPVNAPGYKMTIDEILAQQMDTPQVDAALQKYDENGNPIEGEYYTPNEAVPIFAAQAAAGLTDGILDYWQGSHIGALGRGTAVCLGYTKAFTYLVQYMHPEVYGTSANADMSKSTNWKTADDLYYTDGELDITKNYIVDDVRITFDASVTMYGETEENFNSDHFWNAVQIDGKWYYIDPCYTDVYTEVMMRDRVETDGSMNHMYFLFSHTTATELYDGNFKEIKTLYESAATHTDFEDSWISRVKSNTYFDGGYAYYIYDSTDLITLMQDANSENADTSDLMNQEYKYKLVRHKLTTTDAGSNGDTDYETLIEFNYKANEDDEETIARVRNSSGTMVENVQLTELYARHEEYAEVYPSLALTAAFYNGKVYFNVANVIMSYEVSTGTLALVKEYNVVRGVRDDTNAFGGMAFTVTTGSSYDFEVQNHPIAGMTIKNDGKMYVSVATNFAFISGKDPHNSSDQSSYGYEFEESNYNSAYNSYTTSRYGDINLEDYGYEEETNDNDEFMWTANFVETLTMSHLTGTSHRYSEVSVPAYCGQNAYTENRCTTCGIAEADSRVEVEGSAPAGHHYVKFNETYYTKDDSGNWNTGDVYICTVCGFHIEEPTEPTKNDNVSEEDYQEQLEIYEENKAIYDEAVATAGHTYIDDEAVWAEDLSSVTVQNMECASVCIERKNYLDCLLQDDTMTIALDEAITLPVGIVGTIGTCEEGVTQIYGATETFEYEFIADKPVAVSYGGTQLVQLEPGTHDFENCICTMCGEFSVKRISGDGRVETAIATADALKEALGVETFDSIIIAYGDDFADALVGSYLATVKGAPILLHVKSGAGDDLNEYYIDDNLTEGGTVYILGGIAAIPESIEDGLKATGYNVVRLAGADRYETGLAILKEAGVSEDDEILIATGGNFADSLSASATGKPILTVNTYTNKLTDSQIEFLKEHANNQYAIIGGTGAVSQTLQDAIDAIVEKDIVRVYGENREATSVRVAKRYFEEPTFALLAFSNNFPDGLCAGPLAYALNAPLLLTSANKETVTADYISNTGISNGYVMGGPAAVSDETAKLCFGITSEMEIPAK